VDTVNVQDTRTVPGENIGAGVFDNHAHPTNPYSTGQYQHALALRQHRLSRNQHGNYAKKMTARLIRKPVTLTTVMLAVVHQKAL
jgi:hypothetical protein